MSERQLQFCAVNRGLIGLDGPVKLTYLSLLRIQLLLGNNTFVEQQFEALKIGFSVLALSLVFGQRTLRLLQDYLKRPRIDLRQHIPLMYKLPFLESHAD